MSFSIEAFTLESSIKALWPLKRTELTQLAEHFKLTVTRGTKKGEICQIIIYLRKLELVLDEELEETSTTALR